MASAVRDAQKCWMSKSVSDVSHTQKPTALEQNKLYVLVLYRLITGLGMWHECVTVPPAVFVVFLFERSVKCSN